MSAMRGPVARIGLPRVVLFTLAMLLCHAPARATVGFSCGGTDDAVKFVVNGAYGTGLGSGLAAFGADIDILLPTAPHELRALHLDRSHVRQDWFVVILIIEARRGEQEESAYLGRYSLRIQWMPPDPGAEAKKLEADGEVSCGTG